MSVQRATESWETPAECFFAGIPSFSGLGFVGGHVPTFWLLLKCQNGVAWNNPSCIWCCTTLASEQGLHSGFDSCPCAHCFAMIQGPYSSQPVCACRGVSVLLSMTMSPSLRVCPCIYVCLSVCQSVSVCASVSASLSLCLCVYVSVSMSVSWRLRLRLCDFVSMSLSLFLCLCPSLCLPWCQCLFSFLALPCSPSVSVRILWRWIAELVDSRFWVGGLRMCDPRRQVSAGPFKGHCPA